MATPFSYQMPSWHEDAPFPVEGNIVNNMATAPWTSGTMLPMLAMYMSQRATGQDQYRDELANQHAYAAQALAQHNAHETQANFIKAMEDKNPAAMRLLAANPNTSSLIGDTDPGALNAFSQEAQRQATAGIVKDTGQGVQGLAMGGMGPPMPDVTALTGLNMQPVDPALVKAAAIRAASGGGGGGGNKEFTTEEGTPGSPDLKITHKYSGPPRTNLQQANPPRDVPTRLGR